MEMKDVIRKKRRECGLTQEQVASFLGVSTPAVNKWESGVTYPDISLLPSLARLLKTDLNTLMCFRENLTQEDIAGIMNTIVETGREEGMEKAFLLVQEQVKGYPCCAELLCQMATLLKGMVMILPCTDEQIQKKHAYASELYERVVQCDDPVCGNRARYMLASEAIQNEEYDKAQELIAQLPEYNTLDKRQLQISMYMKQRKNAEAAELLECKLNFALQEVFLLLNHLATVAVWENDSERAWELAEYSQKVMGIYNWKYSMNTVALSVAMEERDARRCISILKEMLEALSEPWDISSSILYSHIKKKEADTTFQSQMIRSLLTAMEKDEQFEFLWENTEFRELLERYKTE